LNLPVEFIRNVEGAFGEAGRQFIANLPASINEASRRWGLIDVHPSPTLSYNYVAFAKRASTTPLRGSAQRGVVLKMGVPDRELKSEMAALRLFDGDGACRLIDCDEEKYWMLLERLKPGVMLATLADDEEATHIAAEVMLKVWRPMESGSSLAPPARAGVLPKSRQQVSPRRHGDAVGLHNFIQLTDWFEGLKRLRARFNGETGPFNKKLVERVERSVQDFFIENHKPVLMHGDFHHFNILSSERGWLVIDPKGVIGPAGYEVGPFLINPWGDLLNGINYRLMTKRRIDILHEHLGFERERIREWGLAHAILSAWWSMEDHGEWDFALNFAEMIASLDINE